MASASVSANMALSSVKIKRVGKLFVVLNSMFVLEGFPHNGINPDIEKQGRSDISLADSSLDWKFLWLVCFAHCCLSHSVMLGEVG